MRNARSLAQGRRRHAFICMTCTLCSCALCSAIRFSSNLCIQHSSRASSTLQHFARLLSSRSTCYPFDTLDMMHYYAMQTFQIIKRRQRTKKILYKNLLTEKSAPDVHSHTHPHELCGNVSSRRQRRWCWRGGGDGGGAIIVDDDDDGVNKTAQTS